MSDPMLREGVSPLRTEDVDQTVEVWEASVRATHDFASDADIDFFSPLVRAELPTLPVFVVRDEAGKVAGFIGVLDGKVEMLFVDPAWRGQGIGRRLMAYAMESLERDDARRERAESAGAGVLPEDGL